MTIQTSLLNINKSATAKKVSQSVNVSRPDARFAADENLSNIAKDVCSLWPRYSNSDINDLISVREDGNLLATIPAHLFQGKSLGKFIIKLIFPELRDDVPYVKIGISYITNNDGSGKTIQKDDSNISDSWDNLNSNAIPLGDLLDRELGYFAEDCHKAIFQWFTNNVGTSANLKVTPTSDVQFTLRATKAQESNEKSSRAPGELVNVAIWQIGFQNATLLKQVGSLMNGAVSRMSSNFSDLQARFGVPVTAQSAVPVVMAAPVMQSTPSVAEIDEM